MADSFFSAIDDPQAGGAETYGRYLATEHTAGPWDQRLQHAGPISALLARAVERLGSPGHPLPAPGLVARLSLDILSPVPVGEVEVKARILRAGSRVGLCEAEALAVDPRTGKTAVVARLAAWRIRLLADRLAVPATPAQPPPSEPGKPSESSFGWGGGYLEAMSWNMVRGDFSQPGPALVWNQMRVGLLGCEEPTGLQRVLALADSGSGISAVANPAELLFVNTDISVHLHREPVSARLWMQSETILNPGGVGLASSVIGDEQGSIGVAAQTLFIAPR